MKARQAKPRHRFQPVRLGRFTAPKRIKYGACCVSNRDGRDDRGSEREFARMRDIARTGCGLVTNQGAHPDPLGEGKGRCRQPAICDDTFLLAFERIAADI